MMLYWIYGWEIAVWCFEGSRGFPGYSFLESAARTVFIFLLLLYHLIPTFCSKFMIFLSWSTLRRYLNLKVLEWLACMETDLFSRWSHNEESSKRVLGIWENPFKLPGQFFGLPSNTIRTLAQSLLAPLFVWPARFPVLPETLKLL